MNDTPKERLRKRVVELEEENRDLKSRIEHLQYTDELILKRAKEVTALVEKRGDLMRVIRNMKSVKEAIGVLKEYGLLYINEARVLQEAGKVQDVMKDEDGRCNISG